ncbi:MAG: response regulator transcription factor [Roseivirga sp.]|nr:response regulator transcription factor [Roseivirga sp.]
MSEPKLKCIVVDDEPMALEMLSDYVKSTPFLELTGSFHQPLEALTFIQSNKTDLLFTDISMPGLSGIQFIKSLQAKPLCILTTAYSEYALEGYDLDVVDYLLKPIEFERFIKAANRALELFKLKNTTNEVAEPASEKQQTILIKSGTKTHQVKLSDIRWVEASGNYVVFHLLEKEIMSLTNIRDVEALLPEEQFTRTHRSFVVSRAHIETIEPHEITISGIGIPISKSYRKAVLNKLMNS